MGRGRPRAAPAAAPRRPARTRPCRGRGGRRRRGLPLVACAASRRRSTRSLCQPSIAWPTSTVSSTSPSSRVGRSASAATTVISTAVSTAWRGWAACTSSTGVVSRTRAGPVRRSRGATAAARPRRCRGRRGRGVAAGLGRRGRPRMPGRVSATGGLRGLRGSLAAAGQVRSDHARQYPCRGVAPREVRAGRRHFSAGARVAGSGVRHALRGGRHHSPRGSVKTALRL